MAHRQRINVQDYYDEGGYGDEDDYYGELDDEERAIKESKKEMKKAKKQAKSKYAMVSDFECDCIEAKGVQEEDIDAVESQFLGVFTRE